MARPVRGLDRHAAGKRQHMVSLRDPDARESERKRVVTALLDDYGTTYAEEIGIDLRGGRPAPLFQLLCACVLFGARIRASAAVQASRALFDQGWTTAQKMAASTWEERTRTLNRNGYARYDESKSRLLGQTAAQAIAQYGGDLRRLREGAAGDPLREHELLTRFPGIGGVGADIFLREAQVAWRELAPFADERALRSARKLGLGDSTEELARLVPEDQFAHFVAALVRVDLGGRPQTILRRTA